MSSPDKVSRTFGYSSQVPNDVSSNFDRLWTVDPIFTSRCDCITRSVLTIRLNLEQGTKSPTVHSRQSCRHHVSALARRRTSTSKTSSLIRSCVCYDTSGLIFIDSLRLIRERSSRCVVMRSLSQRHCWRRKDDLITQ